MPPAVAFPEIFQIAVEYYDGIIHNHTQYDDESGQCYRVQWNTQQIHNANADECGEWDGYGCHDGGSEGEEYHHDQDDDNHRLDKVQEKVLHRVAYNLGLVSNTGNVHILWKYVLTEVVKQFVDGISVFHDIVALAHLQRNDDTRMSVLLNITFRTVVFPFDGGNIADSHHMVLSIGIYNKVTHFFLGIHRSAHMNRNVLLLVRQRTRWKNQSLRVEFLIELHGTDTVGREPLVIHIKRQLFLDVSIDAHIAYRIDSPKFIRQSVNISVQFPIGTAVALHGNEQSRRVAEFIVGYQGKYTLRKLLFEKIKTVLDF